MRGWYVVNSLYTYYYSYVLVLCYTQSVHESKESDVAPSRETQSMCFILSTTCEQKSDLYVDPIHVYKFNNIDCLDQTTHKVKET